IPMPSAERLADGDDLLIIVPGIDEGVPARLWTLGRPGASQLALPEESNVLSVSGVAPFFEGQATLALRSEPRGTILAQQNLATTLPGQQGTGLASFDAALTLPTGQLLPQRGEVVSLGTIGTASGRPMYARWGCVYWGSFTPALCPLPNAISPSASRSQ